MSTETNLQLSNIPVFKKITKEVKKEVQEKKVLEPVTPTAFDTLLTAEQIANKNGKTHMILPNRNGYMFKDVSIIERCFLYGIELADFDEKENGLSSLIGKEISVVSDIWNYVKAEFTPSGFRIIRLQKPKINMIQEFDKSNVPVFYALDDTNAIRLPVIAFLVTDAEAEKIDKVKPAVLTAGGILNVIYNPLKNPNAKILQLHRFK